jgi:2-phospho-L-lactate guanylyltransferase (CobY/MobA/RfbA family)
MRWTYKEVNMKYLMLTLALMSLQTYAGQITMVNPQEEQTENGKTLCVYENTNYLFTYVTKGKCPYAKTFNTEDSEN